MADAIEQTERLIKLCECGSEAGQHDIIVEVAQFLCSPARVPLAYEFLTVGAFVDAAITLLPDGAIWRKYTDDSAAVYSASPYNAAAQVRYDGFNRVTSLAICAANLQRHLAPLLKARAAEARRVAA